MNKLTVGLESQKSVSGPRFCLLLVFHGFAQLHHAAINSWQKVDPQHDWKSQVTSL